VSFHFPFFGYKKTTRRWLEKTLTDMDSAALPRMGNSLKSHGFDIVDLFIHNKKPPFGGLEINY